MSKQEPKIESNINIPTGESPQDPEPEKNNENIDQISYDKNNWNLGEIPFPDLSLKKESDSKFSIDMTDISNQRLKEYLNEDLLDAIDESPMTTPKNIMSFDNDDIDNKDLFQFSLYNNKEEKEINAENEEKNENNNDNNNDKNQIEINDINKIEEDEGGGHINIINENIQNFINNEIFNNNNINSINDNDANDLNNVIKNDSDNKNDNLINIIKNDNNINDLNNIIKNENDKNDLNNIIKNDNDTTDFSIENKNTINDDNNINENNNINIINDVSKINLAEKNNDLNISQENKIEKENTEKKEEKENSEKNEKTTQKNYYPNQYQFPFIQFPYVTQPLMNTINSSGYENKFDVNKKYQVFVPFTLLKKNVKPKKPFEIREGDWTCSNCNNLNFSFRVKCNRCFISKEQSELDKNKENKGNKENKWNKENKEQKYPQMTNKNYYVIPPNTKMNTMQYKYYPGFIYVPVQSQFPKKDKK